MDTKVRLYRANQLYKMINILNGGIQGKKTKQVNLNKNLFMDHGRENVSSSQYFGQTR